MKIEPFKINKLDDTESFLKKIIHISLFVYLFLLVFPHTTTLKEISFLAAAFCWALLRLRKSESFITLNPITISLSLFIGIAFITSIIGMDPLDNLKRFKGELLTIFILFLIVATEYATIQKVKSLLLSPVIAFAIYTLLTVDESFNYGLSYFWDKTLHEQGVWIDGYVQKGITLFPLTLSLFLINRDSKVRYFFLLFALIEFSVITAYGKATPFISISVSILLCALFAKPKKFRLWVIGFIAGIILLSVLILNIYRDNSAVIEYKRKLQGISHPIVELKKERGFSDRRLFWDAAIEIIKDRPIFGYGWGMKKYQKIIKKFLDKWETTKPYMYNFYIQYKDKFIPPHNLFIEITVQSGLLGLTLFITFIGIYLVYLLKRVIYKNISYIDHNFSLILIGGTFLSFMIMNLMNNELGNISGKILFTVLGAGAAQVNNRSENI